MAETIAKRNVMVRESASYQNIFENVQHPILLGFGGSHAYGTNIEGSDIDIRGIALNPKEELIGCKPDFEQYCRNNDDEDVTIYSLKKMTSLLMACNPNTIEMLGLRPEERLFVSEEGQMLIDNAHLFLSKAAINSFGGYAKQQLTRLVNKSGRAKEMAPQNEIRSLQKARPSLKEYGNVELSFYEGEDGQPAMSGSFNMTVNAFCGMAAGVLNIHSDYKKSARNNKAISHGKICKHAMHLMRLYMMACDILKRHEIVTYREKEHDLLMAIRNGEFMEDDGVTPTESFELILAEWECKFKRACEQTTLPDRPDKEAINKLIMKINESLWKVG